MPAEYISRKVMDRYFDKFTRKLVRMNIRIMEMEAAWNRLTLELIDLKSQIDFLVANPGISAEDKVPRSA